LSIKNGISIVSSNQHIHAITASSNQKNAEQLNPFIATI